jgi:hypothetical protein
MEPIDPDHGTASLRQQVMALAAVSGVLLAALRRGGLMTSELEAMLARGLCDAAADKAESVRPDWEGVVAAVQKISSAAANATADPDRLGAIPSIRQGPKNPAGQAS